MVKRPRFFTRSKPMEDNNENVQEENTDNVVEDVSAVEEGSNEPAEEVADTEKKNESDETDSEPEVSAVETVAGEPCPECEGKGLKDPETRCPACKGSGVVQEEE